MTDAGREMRRAMWPVYAAAVQQAVGARLSSEEAEGLVASPGPADRAAGRAPPLRVDRRGTGVHP